MWLSKKLRGKSSASGPMKKQPCCQFLPHSFSRAKATASLPAHCAGAWHWSPRGPHAPPGTIIGHQPGVNVACGSASGRVCL